MPCCYLNVSFFPFHYVMNSRNNDTMIYKVSTSSAPSFEGMKQSFIEMGVAQVLKPGSIVSVIYYWFQGPGEI